MASEIFWLHSCSGERSGNAHTQLMGKNTVNHTDMIFKMWSLKMLMSVKNCVHDDYDHAVIIIKTAAT